MFIIKVVYGGKDFELLAELIAGSEIDERVASDRVQLIGLVPPQLLIAVADYVQSEADTISNPIVREQLELILGNAGNVIAVFHQNFPFVVCKSVIRTQYLEIVFEGGVDKTVGQRPI